MKRLAICLTVIVSAASMCGAAVGQTIGYVQVNPPSVQPGGFNTNTGTVGQLTVTGLASNQCVQTGPGGVLMVTGSNCGTSGGGGSSSLQVTIGGVQVTSPTPSISLKSGQFTGVAIGSTATIALNGSSVTLQGNLYNIANIAADTGTFITASSTSLTYLQISSAVATYIQRPELVNGYLSLSSATATYLQTSSATSTYLQKSSATVTYCHADGTNCTGGTITLTGDVSGSGTGSILTTAGAVQSNIKTFTSSITVTGAGGLTLANVASGIQCLHANAQGQVTGTGADCGSGGGGAGGGAGVIAGTGNAYDIPYVSIQSSNTLAMSGNIKVFPSSVTILGAVPILSTSSLQSGSTFYVSSGTVGNLNLYIPGASYPTTSSNGAGLLAVTGSNNGFPVVITSQSDGQLPIGRSTGGGFILGNITGTAGQVVVTNGGGTIALNTGSNVPGLSSTNTWSGGNTHKSSTTFSGSIVISSTVISGGSAGNGAQVLTSSGTAGPPYWKTASGGGGTPASPSGSVQFNNGGSFGGDSGLTWDNTGKALTITGAAGSTPLTLNATGAGGFSSAFNIVDTSFGTDTFSNYIGALNICTNGSTPFCSYGSPGDTIFDTGTESIIISNSILFAGAPSNAVFFLHSTSSHTIVDTDATSNYSFAVGTGAISTPYYNLSVSTMGTVQITSNTILSGTTIYKDNTASAPVTWLARGSGATSSTFWRGDGTWATPAGSGGGGQLIYPSTGMPTFPFGVLTSTIQVSSNTVLGAGTTIYADGRGVFGGQLAASNLSGSNTGDQTITLTGDVTGSGTGSFTTTAAALQNNVRTFSSSETITGTGGLSVTYGVLAGSATIGQLLVSSNTVLPGTTFYQNGTVVMGPSTGVTTDTDYALRLSSANADPRFTFLYNGSLISSGTAPAITSCGASPTLSTGISNFAGTVTAGTGATSCTITFANGGFTNSPTCVVSDETLPVTYTLSTTALVISNATLGTSKTHYVCAGH